MLMKEEPNSDAVARSFATLLWMTAFALVGGCTSVATVSYKPINSPADMTADVFDTYALQSNQIVITGEQAAAPDQNEADASNDEKKPKAKPKDKPKPEVTVQVSSSPVESSGRKLGLIHSDNFWTSSKVNLAKKENTDLLQEAGIEVTNNSITLINQAGELAKAIIPLIPFAATNERADLSTPIQIDMWEAVLKDNAQRNAFTAPLPPQIKGVSITLHEIPNDAMGYAKVQWPLKSSTVLYAACRTADVTVYPAGANNSSTFQVRIADPNFIQQAPLPFKGKVVMHSQCGASVVSDEAGDATNALTVGTALATQAKALSDAIAEKKKGKSGDQKAQ